MILKNSPHRRLLLAILCCAVTFSSACSTRDESSFIAEDSFITPAKFSVEKDYVVAQIPLNHDTHEPFEALSEIYKMKGYGPLHVVTAYDNSTGKTTKKQAKDNANRIARHFYNDDIKNTVISNAYIKNANPNITVIGFQTATIKPSKICADKTMPGYYDKTDIFLDDYELGCQTAHMMLRQVANKNDLIGTSGLGGNNDAVRATNIIENTYRPGEAQDYLPGFVISELGGSGE